MKTHIRRGDQVLVRSGNERGVRGKVMSVNMESSRAVVEGVGMRKRHVRKTRDNPQGGIVEKESSVHISNLMVVCPKCSKPTRVARKLVREKYVRACKSCGEAFAS